MQPQEDIELARFVHPFFQANAWLVMSPSHAILIDTACNDEADGERLVKFVRDTGRTLQAVLLSHGHPDVWLGVKSLRTAFPKAPIYVAKAEILDDIVNMGEIMDQAGMLANSQALSPKHYDYRTQIQVLNGSSLELFASGGLRLELSVTEKPTEHTHLTLVSIPALESLFVSDLAYNQVHAWAGIGVDRKAVQNWLSNLAEVIGKSRANLKVLTGHGEATDLNVLYTQRTYLEELLAAVDEKLEGAALVERMQRRFPAHAGREFQLAMTAQNRAALA